MPQPKKPSLAVVLSLSTAMEWLDTHKTKTATVLYTNVALRAEETLVAHYTRVAPAWRTFEKKTNCVCKTNDKAFANITHLLTRYNANTIFVAGRFKPKSICQCFDILLGACMRCVSLHRRIKYLNFKMSEFVRIRVVAFSYERD